MRLCSDFAGGNGAPIVDKMIGEAFLTVKSVADNIDAVSTAAANMEVITKAAALSDSVVTISAQLAADIAASDADRVAAGASAVAAAASAASVSGVLNSLNADFTSFSSQQQTLIDQIASIGSHVNDIVTTGATITVTRTTSVAAMRAIPPSTTFNVRTSGYYAAGDGGANEYYGVVGTIAGTYVDNGGAVIVPTGGDGSTAWLSVVKPQTIRQWGARGDLQNITGNVTTVVSSSTVVVSTGAFTSSDVGRMVSVPGAGVSGGLLVATITAVTSGTTVTLSATASTALSAVSKTVQVFTDDTASIQRVLTYAGGVTLVPAGTFVASNLTISRELDLWGEGYECSQVIQKPNATGNLITINGVRHPSFRFMSFGGTPTGNDVIGIVGASSGNQIVGCFVFSAGRDGINVAGTTDNVVVLDTIIEACGRDGVAFENGSTSGSVINCRLNVNIRYGIRASGNTSAPGHRFIGNAIGGGVSGIYIENQWLCAVSGNVIAITSSDGIVLAGGNRCTVIGNSINACSGNGISVLGGTITSVYNTISNNIIKGNIVCGVSLGPSASYNTINGNIIEGNFTLGINLYQSGNNVISNNQILGNGLTGSTKNGIRIADNSTGASSSNSILGNVIDNLGNAACQTVGIDVEASAYYTSISLNRIVAATPVAVNGGTTVASVGNVGWP